MPAARQQKKPETADFEVIFADHEMMGKLVPVIVRHIPLQDRGSKTLTAEAMAAALEDILLQARRDAAASYLNYEATITAVGDSGYLDQRDRLADALVPSAVNLVPESVGLAADTPRVRYFVNGTHPDDGGGWSDWVDGISSEEGRFHALWKMALDGRELPDDIDDHVGAMQECTIDYCVPDPVTKDELAEAARDLLVEIGGTSGPAYDRIMNMLRELEVDVSSIEAASAPKL